MRLPSLGSLKPIMTRWERGSLLGSARRMKAPQGSAGDPWSKPALVVDLDESRMRVLEVSPSSGGPILKWGASSIQVAEWETYRLAASPPFVSS